MNTNKIQAEQLPQDAVISSNKVASFFCKHNEKSSFLDSNNIVWKWIDNNWIGKRSVWTFDFRACWLEDTTIDNIKSFWCGGKEADYNEVFTQDL